MIFLLTTTTPHTRAKSSWPLSNSEASVVHSALVRPMPLTAARPCGGRAGFGGRARPAHTALMSEGPPGKPTPRDVWIRGRGPLEGSPETVTFAPRLKGWGVLTWRKGISLTGKAKGGRKSVRTQKWPVPGHSDKTDLGGRLRESLEFNLAARGEVREVMWSHCPFPVSFLLGFSDLALLCCYYYFVC